MGSWINKRFKEGSVSSVTKAMDNFLNTLNGNQGASAKTVMANEAGKDPIGGVFYYDSTYTKAPLQAGSWTVSTFENRDAQVLFDEATARLNKLPLEKALATNLSLSEKEDAPKTMAMFQPALAIPV